MVAKPVGHADALFSAVKTAVGGVQCYLDEVPASPPYPYVVVWSDSAVHGDESLGGQRERGVFNPAVTVAATSSAIVRQVRERLESLYEPGRQVSSPGRLIELEKVSSTTVSRDTDIADKSVFWCRDLLEMRSYAA